MEIATNLAHLDAQLTLLAEHWNTFSKEELRERPGPGRWSRKQLLGHLIDSATNNHRRFVLAQVAPPPLQLLAYDQEAWVQVAAYQYFPSDELLMLWVSYNRLIIHLLKQIPATMLTTECLTISQHSTTLHWLVGDYVLHLEHHVRQITNQHSWV